MFLRRGQGAYAVTHQAARSLRILQNVEGRKKEICVPDVYKRQFPGRAGRVSSPPAPASPAPPPGSASGPRTALCPPAVSYTHLDVYKRQVVDLAAETSPQAVGHPLPG